MLREATRPRLTRRGPWQRVTMPSKGDLPEQRYLLSDTQFCCRVARRERQDAPGRQVHFLAEPLEPEVMQVNSVSGRARGNPGVHRAALLPCLRLALGGLRRSAGTPANQTATTRRARTRDAGLPNQGVARAPHHVRET